MSHHRCYCRKHEGSRAYVASQGSQPMHGDNLAAVWKVAPYENKHINSALGPTLAAVVRFHALMVTSLGSEWQGSK